MSSDQPLAPISETSSAAEWKIHLRACGFRALRGQSFDVFSVRLPEARVVEATQKFLFAVDGVSSATMIHDAERRRASLEAALYDYMNALAWCIGVMLYISASEVDAFTEDLTREVESARDAFHVLAPSHWDARDLHAAAAEVDRAFLVEGTWPKKFAPLSFTYDARRAQAA